MDGACLEPAACGRDEEVCVTVRSVFRLQLLGVCSYMHALLLVSLTGC